MAIATNILISQRSLAGNPVIAQLYAGANASKRYRVYRNNSLLYEGLIYSLTDTYTRVDISGLFSDQKINAGVTHCKIVLVTSINQNDVESDATDFTVYGGGISKLLQRSLISTDIFVEKLKKANNNFFLTTRTSDRIIVIPEDELMPLSFYGAGMKLTVKADGLLALVNDYSTETDETLKTWDFATIRSSYMESRNQFVSVFDIFTDTSYSCSVVITQAERSTDFFLKFRNSWGAWDKIGIRGDVDYAPVFSEVTKTNKWDESVNSFITTQKRKELTNTLMATTGYKNSDERLLLLDMLFSSEVIFIAYGNEYTVNVTTDSSIFTSTKTDPQMLNLKLELKDTDEFYNPILMDKAYKEVVTADLKNINANGATIIT